MGPLPNGRTPWLIHGGVPNHFQVLGWSFKLRMDRGWLRCGRRDWQTGCNFCWKSFQVTWKTAVATLISINLKPPKPAIQLPKRKCTFLCFPGRKQCYGGCVHESLSVVFQSEKSFGKYETHLTNTVLQPVQTAKYNAVEISLFWRKSKLILLHRSSPCCCKESVTSSKNFVNGFLVG